MVETALTCSWHATPQRSDTSTIEWPSPAPIPVTVAVDTTENTRCGVHRSTLSPSPSCESAFSPNPNTPAKHIASEWLAPALTATIETVDSAPETRVGV